MLSKVGYNRALLHANFFSFMKKYFTLFAASGFFLSACAVQEDVSIPVIPNPVVQEQDLSEPPHYSVSEVATVKPLREVELVARKAGTLEELSVTLGDWVSANQVIGRLDLDETNESALINLDNARLQLDNARDTEGDLRENNLDAITRAELRVESLELTLERLERNLDELKSQNSNGETSLSLQKDTLLQNLETAEDNYDTLIARLDQSLFDLFESAETSVDGVYFNIETNFTKVEDIINPKNKDFLDAASVLQELGATNSAQRANLISDYNNLKDEVFLMRLDYEAQLPFVEDNFSDVLAQVGDDLDEFRSFLADFRIMLDNSIINGDLPQATLDAYKAQVTAAESAVLADLSKLDGLRQSYASYQIDRSNQITVAQNNIAVAQNQLADANNSLLNYFDTSDGSVQDLESQIEQTKKDLILAQVDLESAERTVDVQDVSKQLEINNLSNQVRLAESSIQDDEIEATTDGVISELAVDQGDYLSPGTLIGTVIQSQQVVLVFYLSEQDAGRLSVGQEFQFSLSSDSDELHLGNISKIAPTADPNSRKIRFEGTIQDSGLNLRPETYVNVQLDLTDGTFDASKIYAPLNAVIFGQGENYVYLVEEDISFLPGEYVDHFFASWFEALDAAKPASSLIPVDLRTHLDFSYDFKSPLARRRPVDIGDQFGVWVEILEGLQMTDRLIVDGQRNLPPEGEVTVDIAP